MLLRKLAHGAHLKLVAILYV